MDFTITLTKKLAQRIIRTPIGTLSGTIHGDEAIAHINKVNTNKNDAPAHLSLGKCSENLRATLKENQILLNVRGEKMAAFIKKKGRLEQAKIRLISREQLFKRNRGLNVSFLRGKRVAVVGLGVGGRIAKLLVQAGVEIIILIDPDRVEPFLNQDLPLQDTGRFKTKAYADQIKGKNPWVSVKTFEEDITKLSEAELKKIFQGVDLLIGATDSIKAQFALNEIGLSLGIKTLFIGYYPGAWGGEVVWVMPGQTACYNCIFESRLKNPDTPLHASALGSDIELMASYAAPYALALLGDPNRQNLLKPDKNAIFFSLGCAPRWIFKEAFEKVEARTERGCELCSRLSMNDKIKKVEKK